MSSERRDNTLGWDQHWGPPPSVPGPWQPSKKEVDKIVAAMRSQNPANTSPPSLLDRVRGILGL